jgi:hypothetical protein
VLVAALLLLPPIGLLAGRTLLGLLSTRLGRAAHVATVGGLVGLTVVPPAVRAIGLSAMMALVLLLAVVAASAVAYTRAPIVERYLVWTAPAAIVFAAIFLVFTPVRTLVLPSATVVHAYEAGTQTSVIFVVLDELSLPTLLTPAGEVDAEAFPGFARLADTSTLYPNATTVSHATRHALPALLTGRLPSHGGIAPTASSYPDNLFTLLAHSRDLAVYETVTELCPLDLCGETAISATSRDSSLLRDTGVIYLHLALPSGPAKRWLPPLADRWAGFADGGDALPAATGSPDEVAVGPDWHHDPVPVYRELILPSVEAASEPSLWFAHLMLPHVPWRFLPSGQHYQGRAYNTPGWSPETERWSADPHLPDLAIQRYLLQTQLTDHLIGETLDMLEEEGMTDDVLLIVTADHGLAFEPGLKRRALEDETVTHILSVPLFVKYPGQRQAKIDDRNAEIIDIVPTIADVLDVALPWETDGASLAGDDPQRPVKRYGAGGETELPPTINDLDSAAERLRRPFGGSFATPYAIGEHRDLHGERVPAVADVDDLTVRLDRRDDYDNVDLDAAFVPARVTGSLLGSEPGDRFHLAVAVNGRIAGLTVTHVRRDGTVGFGAMIDPAMMRTGANRIDVHLVDEDGTLLRLPEEPA